jgi:hypothetical protein
MAAPSLSRVQAPARRQPTPGPWSAAAGGGDRSGTQRAPAGSAGKTSSWAGDTDPRYPLVVPRADQTGGRHRSLRSQHAPRSRGDLVGRAPPAALGGRPAKPGRPWRCPAANPGSHSSGSGARRGAARPTWLALEAGAATGGCPSGRPGGAASAEPSACALRETAFGVQLSLEVGEGKTPVRRLELCDQPAFHFPGAFNRRLPPGDEKIGCIL